MSDSMESPDMLAAEYVIGLLDAGEMLAVRRQALNDGVLADAIGQWERRLTPLVALVPLAEPPLAIWSRIEQSIASSSATEGNVVPMAPRPTPGPTPDRSLWRNVALWRATTAAAVALAAVFAGVAFLPRQAPPLALAALVPMGGPSPAFLAEAQSDGRIMISAVAPATVPNGRDLELWLLPPGAQRPTSLGVLPSGGKSLLLGAPPPPGSQLLVSLEPTGGSPTGQPTGQVLYGGTLAIRSGT